MEHSREECYRFALYWLRELHTKSVDIASEYDCIEIVRYVLDEIDISQSRMNQALVCASRYNNLEVVQLLLQYGARANSEPLGEAIRRGHISVVRLLSDSMGRVFSSDLTLAAQAGHVEVIRFLLDRGANVSVDDNVSLVLAVTRGYLDVVKLLLERGADLTARNGEILSYPIREEHLETLKFLLSHGTWTVNQINHARKVAVSYLYEDAIKLFQDHNAK
jgi:ankyrin repeat protein